MVRVECYTNNGEHIGFLCNALSRGNNPNKKFGINWQIRNFLKQMQTSFDIKSLKYVIVKWEDGIVSEKEIVFGDKNSDKITNNNTTFYTLFSISDKEFNYYNQKYGPESIRRVMIIKENKK